ncbi:Lipopolysaccharide-induced tumor necrosis factor-alpha factor-like [Holothuria leucospilota]|uniref:Lipopolysaccharide-induced tumor necrosis factor-alpha factor-like n=1 Tax=Holothuria leucospilota TaxID=206669 RepID=A0A9Q1H639_HOLLE|nr:Lipopolysaccharide-induced tumor necrosis factor-alpha factor-like [Holothuria leucospilota]
MNIDPLGNPINLSYSLRISKMTDEKSAAYPPPPPLQQQAPPPPYSEGYAGLPTEQPQPAGYVPPQPVQPPTQTVVVTTVSNPPTRVIYRDVPVMVQCPNCKNNVTSRVVFENGLLVWICVLAIAFLFQLWLGCCLIPLFIDALKDVRHTCPVCGIHLGLYQRI